MSCFTIVEVSQTAQVSCFTILEMIQAATVSCFTIREVMQTAKVSCFTILEAIQAAQEARRSGGHETASGASGRLSRPQTFWSKFNKKHSKSALTLDPNVHSRIFCASLPISRASRKHRNLRHLMLIYHEIGASETALPGSF